MYSPPSTGVCFSCMVHWQLEAVQHRAARWVCGSRRNATHAEVLVYVIRFLPGAVKVAFITLQTEVFHDLPTAQYF